MEKKSRSDQLNEVTPDMTTTYYDIAEPWTSIMVEDHDEDRVKIKLWERVQIGESSVGDLLVRRDNLSSAIWPLVDESREICMRYAGSEGVHLRIYQYPKNRQVISEYGEIHNFDVLKSEYPIKRNKEHIHKMLDQINADLNHPSSVA